MTPLLLLLTIEAAAPTAGAPNSVAIVVYQGAGREAARAKALTDALATEVTARGFTVLPAAQAQQHERSAAMCGEDSDCLATIGQRAGVELVLGVGLATAGKQLVVGARLIDAAGGGPPAFSVKVPLAGLELTALSRQVAQALFAGRTPRPLDAPSRVEPPPSPLTHLEPAPSSDAPPVAVSAAVAPPLAPRPLRSAAIGTAIGAGALAVAGGTLGLVAGLHYQTLSTIPAPQRPAADGDQRALNLAADATVGTAVVAGAVSVVLFLLDAGR